MARSGRPSGRAQADWVYRGNKFLLSGDLTVEEEENLSGTYYSPFQMVVGLAGRTAQVLYDSAAYMGGRYGQGRETASGLQMSYAIPPSARPDTPLGGALIHAVDMTVNFLLLGSTWVAGAKFYMGWRIICAEQDPETGQLLLHPSYSMWQDVGGLNAQPSTWANGRQNCAEGRIWRDFNNTNDTNINMVVSKFLRFKRRLAENEGLFLYLELHPNSVISAVFPWCRTLVTDTRA